MVAVLSRCSTVRPLGCGDGEALALLPCPLMTDASQLTTDDSSSHPSPTIDEERLTGDERGRLVVGQKDYRLRHLVGLTEAA